MTFTIYIKHNGKTYDLPNYRTRERAMYYISWYEKKFGKAEYDIKGEVL